MSFIQSVSKKLLPLSFASLSALSLLSIGLPVKAGTLGGLPTSTLSGPPVWFGYTCLATSDSTYTAIAKDCDTAHSQIVTQVARYNATPSSPDQVAFTFFNRPQPGSTFQASSIAQVYFDDTNPYSLFRPTTVTTCKNGKCTTTTKLAPFTNPKIYSSSGVNFSQNANPSNLPGGQAPAYSFFADYSAGANSPVQPNGVNASTEWLSIVFDADSTFADPFNAVITDLQRGSLRVGVHIQGFEDGQSVSMINEAVPEPITILGSGAALGFGLLLKRKSQKSEKVVPASTSELM